MAQSQKKNYQSSSTSKKRNYYRSANNNYGLSQRNSNYVTNSDLRYKVMQSQGVFKANLNAYQVLCIPLSTVDMVALSCAVEVTSSSPFSYCVVQNTKKFADFMTSNVLSTAITTADENGDPKHEDLTETQVGIQNSSAWVLYAGNVTSFVELGKSTNYFTQFVRQQSNLKYINYSSNNGAYRSVFAVRNPNAYKYLQSQSLVNKVETGGTETGATFINGYNYTFYQNDYLLFIMSAVVSDVTLPIKQEDQVFSLNVRRQYYELKQDDVVESLLKNQYLAVSAVALEQKNKELKQQNDDLTKANNSLTKQNTLYQSEISSLQQQNSQLQSKISTSSTSMSNSNQSNYASNVVPDHMGNFMDSVQYNLHQFLTNNQFAGEVGDFSNSVREIVKNDQSFVIKGSEISQYAVNKSVKCNFVVDANQPNDDNQTLFNEEENCGCVGFTSLGDKTVSDPQPDSGSIVYKYNMQNTYPQWIPEITRDVPVEAFHSQKFLMSQNIQVGQSFVSDQVLAMTQVQMNSWLKRSITSTGDQRPINGLVIQFCDPGNDAQGQPINEWYQLGHTSQTSYLLVKVYIRKSPENVAISSTGFRKAMHAFSPMTINFQVPSSTVTKEYFNWVLSMETIGNGNPILSPRAFEVLHELLCQTQFKLWVRQNSQDPQNSWFDPQRSFTFDQTAGFEFFKANKVYIDPFTFILNKMQLADTNVQDWQSFKKKVKGFFSKVGRIFKKVLPKVVPIVSSVLPPPAGTVVQAVASVVTVGENGVQTVSPSVDTLDLNIRTRAFAISPSNSQTGTLTGICTCTPQYRIGQDIVDPMDETQQWTDIRDGSFDVPVQLNTAENFVYQTHHATFNISQVFNAAHIYQTQLTGTAPTHQNMQVRFKFNFNDSDPDAKNRTYGVMAGVDERLYNSETGEQ